jgi:hypothetical protein
LLDEPGERLRGAGLGVGWWHDSSEFFWGGFTL